MNRGLAHRLQAIGCVIIVTVMMTDHFLFALQEGFVLAMALVSAVLLGTGILIIKRLDYLDDVSRAEAIREAQRKRKK